MPCTDGGPTMVELEKLQKVEAMLCAVLNVLENEYHLPILKDVSDKIDYKEAGISKKELTRWYEDHKEQDRERRKRQVESQKQQDLFEQAKSKLTQEELQVLKDRRFFL